MIVEVAWFGVDPSQTIGPSRARASEPLATDRPDAWVKAALPNSSEPAVDGTYWPVSQSYTRNGSQVNETSTTAATFPITDTSDAKVKLAVPVDPGVVSALTAAGTTRAVASAPATMNARTRARVENRSIGGSSWGAGS